MAEPIPQVQIESEIMRISRLTEEVTQQLAVRARESAQADVTYKVAHAQALLCAEGPQYVRDAHATVDTADQYQARRIAEARLLAAQEAGRNYRAQLDSLRSINANHRALVSG